MEDRNNDFPLAGISVLVTRAVEQSAGLVDALASRGAEVTVIPSVSISPMPDPEGFGRAMDRVGIYENVILTSINGVDLTLRLLQGKKMGPWDLPPALCVGEKTANAWEDAGGTVAAVPEQYTAEALLDILGEDLGGNHFLIMRPEVVKTELGQAMRKRGAGVDEVVIYRTVVPGEGAEKLRVLLQGGKPDVIFFASPSSVDGTVKMAARGPEPKAQGENDTQNPELRTRNSSAAAEAMTDKYRRIFDIPAICIGPTTAKAAEEAGFKEIYFPDEHTAEGMVEELIVISGKLKSPGTQDTGRRTQ